MKPSDKYKGWTGTILFHGVVLIVLFFLFGFKTKLPLPGDNGVEIGTEVNLGNSDFGFGEIQPLELTDNSQSTTASSENSDYLDQNSEDAPKINNTSQNPADKSDDKQQVNDKALYKGKNKTGTNQGIAGGSGDQGNPDGTPNSNNYTGVSGPGGNISYDMKGRNPKSLMRPVYDSDEEGKIVVTIKADKKGAIIYAKAGATGTNILDSKLWKQCETAALKSSFEAKSDAAIEQQGTITYIFLKLN